MGARGSTISWARSAPGTTRSAHAADSAAGWNTIAGFLGRIRDAIVQYQEVGGRAYFRNVGSTHNDGIEFGLTARPITGLKVFGSYTFANYEFADYKVLNGAAVDTLDGNRLPGVPRHFARVGLRAEPGWGVAVAVDHTLSSSVYADDANTVRVDGWGAGVTNVRVNWNGNLGRAVIRPFAAVNNLFDKQYVGSVTINGFDRVVNAPECWSRPPESTSISGRKWGGGRDGEVLRMMTRWSPV